MERETRALDARPAGGAGGVGSRFGWRRLLGALSSIAVAGSWGSLPGEELLPEFELGFSGGPCPSGTAFVVRGETELATSVACTLATRANPFEDGAQGWSFGVAAEGASITDITTRGTAADPQRVDFATSELTSGEGNEGAVSAVILSLFQAVTLPPEGSETVAYLEVRAPPPAADSRRVRLHYADGLRGSTRPIENSVSFRGLSVRPALQECAFDVVLREEPPLFELGFSGPPCRDGEVVRAGGAASFTEILDCTLTTSGNAKDAGVQGWSIGLAASGVVITDITTEGTAADDAPEGFFSSGYRQVELTFGDGNQGAVSAVALSLIEPATLPPEGTETIAMVEVTGDFPDEGSYEAAIYYMDGLESSGGSVTNRVTFDGASFQPELGECIFRVTSPRVLSPPLVLRCEAGGNEVELVWVNGDRYTSIEIQRNGEVVAALPGTAMAFTDTGAPCGVLEYRITGVAAGASASSRPCTVQVFAPPVEFRCEPETFDGKPAAHLSWSSECAYSRFEIYRDDAFVAELPGSARSFRDLGVVCGGQHDYIFIGVRENGAAGGLENFLLRCQLDIACFPEAFACRASADGVLLSWVNRDANDSLAILRDGAEIARLGGEATRFADANAPAGVHRYELKASIRGRERTSESCRADVRIPPEGLACTSKAGPSGETDVLVTWIHRDAHESLAVIRNGETIAVLDGASSSYRDAGVPCGVHRYELLARIRGADLASPDSCLSDWTCPPELRCAQDGDDAVLEWSLAHAVDSLAIWRDGARLGALPPGASTFRDAGVPSGVHLYRLEAGLMGRTAAAECSLDVRRAPLLACRSAGGGAVLLEWLQRDTYSSVTVLRDGAPVAAVDPRSGSYLDQGLEDARYVYALVAEARGARLESPPCEVTVLDLPGELACRLSVRPGDVTDAVLTWRNESLYESLEVIRDGEVIAGLDPAATVFLDADVPPGLHTYAVIARALGTSGGPSCEVLVESPDAATASVDLGAVDLEDGLRNVRDDLVDGGTGLAVCGSPPQTREARSNLGRDGGGDEGGGEPARDGFFYFEVLDPELRTHESFAIEAVVHDAVELAATVLYLEYTHRDASGPDDADHVFYPPDGSLERKLSGSGSWVLLEWTIEEAGFRGLQPGGADFRIGVRGGAPVCVDTVTVAARVEDAEEIVPSFRRGDFDGDGALTVTDAIAKTAFLHRDGPAPPCPDAADGNDDGVLDTSGALFLLAWLFSQGPPPAPGVPPGACAPDATADVLVNQDCSYDSCG